MFELRWPLCTQTVTLYHADHEAGAVRRTVVHGAFLDRRCRATLGQDGQRQAAAALLVIPERAARFGVDYTLAPMDRVWDGEGPEVPYDGWPALAPDAPGAPPVAVVQYVTPMARRGRPSHLEAGCWWTGSGTGAHSLTR